MFIFEWKGISINQYPKARLGGRALGYYWNGTFYAFQTSEHCIYENIYETSEHSIYGLHWFTQLPGSLFLDVPDIQVISIFKLHMFRSTHVDREPGLLHAMLKSHVIPWHLRSSCSLPNRTQNVTLPRQGVHRHREQSIAAESGFWRWERAHILLLELKMFQWLEVLQRWRTRPLWLINASAPECEVRKELFKPATRCCHNLWAVVCSTGEVCRMLPIRGVPARGCIVQIPKLHIKMRYCCSTAEKTAHKELMPSLFNMLKLLALQYLISTLHRKQNSLRIHWSVIFNIQEKIYFALTLS